LGWALRLLQWLLLNQQLWSLGFVWVEGGRVVGSVSTQRSAPRSNTWLAANVAVHPDYRRRGIAVALMQATLDFVRRQGGREVILQVEDSNLAAAALYRGLSFSRVTTRATWVRPPHATVPAWQPGPFEVRLREAREWAAHFALAQVVRPEGLTWGHPLSPSDFRQNWPRRADQFLSGRFEEHWLATAPDGQIAGALTIQFSNSDGDRLTLLAHPDFQGQVEQPLLVRGLRRLGRRPWNSRLECDADDEAAGVVLADLGFKTQRVLRWMRREIR